MVAASAAAPVQRRKLRREDRAYALQSRDLRDQPVRDQRQLGDLVPLRSFERRAPVQLVDDRGRQSDGADLRQHGGDLELPGRLDAELLRERAHRSLDPRRTPEGHRVRERQDAHHGFHAAAQRLLQQDALAGAEPMQLDRRRYRRSENIRRARLGQEAKDLPLIDRRDRRVEIGLPGEQHAHGVGRDLAHLGEQGRAVHARHPHVGQDHARRPFARDELERRTAARRSLDLVVAPQVELQPLEHIGLVVHAENARTRLGPVLDHGATSSSAAMAGAARCVSSSGRRILKVVPSPTAEAHRIVPPCFSTTDRAMASP